MAKTSHKITLAHAIALAITQCTLAAGGPPVDFVRDVRPILSQHCFACHGPDTHARKAGLSLLDFASATRELEPGLAAIVPGNREESELWLRINDQLDPMPPQSEHNALSSEEIEILGTWIDQGAAYAPHWAYVLPTAAANDPSIDALVEAKFIDQGLAAAPLAEANTLLRRIHLDLTGLPPTIEEVTAFMRTPGDYQAYMEVVDQLLQSPRYGERMAVFWLDLGR